MPTMKDVAKAANVALSTVSLALRNDPKVKESTRRRVLEAAHKLQYRPNGIARDLKTRKTDTICILLHDLGGPFYSELIRGVQDVATSSGYNTIASGSLGGRNGSAVKLLSERRVDGVIVLAPDVDDEVIVQSAGADLPVVVLDRELTDEFVYSVRVDNEQGGYQVTRHLLEVGNRRVVFVSGPADSLDAEHRYRGYVKAMNEFSAPVSKRFDYNGQFTEQGGYTVGKVMSALPELPDAVFASNDEMALGILRAFEEKGIRVPDDVALAGFDNIRIAEYVRPSLTTVQQPMYEMGAVAAQLLFQALSGSKTLGSVRLATNLVVRQSSQRHISHGNQTNL
ncbi:LacI family DNA-binding transcriptional regulator [Alicyclobacillus mengziensis]|uniref:LacI family DNA-binding transcriptional regulator n=1 Tax=Alicyclobacillus mengziensis TaxID=2931921 RepID=A0A9X7Z7E6_9BACL|nr:LacI family DNA-binding transcriptional regulator [Alicyclobacillus mengziensis]QSO47251.1 LacI family DNA-binding transcriptional regulator [Alicyclobacillus mengziensis]